MTEILNIRGRAIARWRPEGDGVAVWCGDQLIVFDAVALRMLAAIRTVRNEREDEPVTTRCPTCAAMGVVKAENGAVSWCPRCQGTCRVPLSPRALPPAEVVRAIADGDRLVEQLVEPYRPVSDEPPVVQLEARNGRAGCP